MLKWKLEAGYLTLPEIFYSSVTTDTGSSPDWAIFNTSLADDLGMGTAAGPEDLSILSGQEPPPGARVFAQSYAGHQFGHFTILGDGRAAVLGEIVDPQGRRWDLQLKGSGRTPYSRGGDGKAVLGPMLREYLIGEYLHAVGIPSTRALSVILSGDAVWREGQKPAAVLCRIGASHIRTGTFQYAAALSDFDALRSLADYAIKRHYPDVRGETNPYLSFLDAAGSAQAELVARWMCVGFVHGVMNTDNVAVSGQALDFGPCAFLDRYRSDQVFSSIDTGGRYAWGRQSAAAAWNHARLAETLIPLLDPDPEKALILANESVERFTDTVGIQLSAGFARKIGISILRDGDGFLIQNLLDWMEKNSVDFTGTFSSLTRIASGVGSAPPRKSVCPLPDEKWLQRWLVRLEDEADPRAVMQEANPAVHPRNRPVQAALDAADAGDMEPFRKLVRDLANPFSGEPEQDYLEQPETDDEKPFMTFCGT